MTTFYFIIMLGGPLELLVQTLVGGVVGGGYYNVCHAPTLSRVSIINREYFQLQNLSFFSSRSGPVRIPLPTRGKIVHSNIPASNI